MKHFQRWLLVFTAPWMIALRLHANNLDYFILNQNDPAESMKAFESTDEDEVDLDVHRGKKLWELSLGAGYAYLVKSTYQNVSYSNGVSFDGAFLYQLYPQWQVGVDGGYNFNHSSKEEIFTFQGIDIRLERRIEIIHAAPIARFGFWRSGPWGKLWRPYVQGGAGWYQVYQKLTFKVEANRFLYQQQLADASNDYLGINGGAGLECELYPQGLVGIQLIYHRIFSTPSNIEYLSPGVRFSYLF